MNSLILQVENLSKKYCRNLKRSLWYGLKDLSNEMLLQRNGRSELRRDEFWALKDVTFNLYKGETLGLIGHNGAGKSTLLKLINGSIKPDEGSIHIRGRVGALIELGTGFNPILTGRENIYINAAVLGMSREEVDRRLADIIDFAEIGDFIDAPLQAYSSGMKVRLGFSVAANLNPEMLLIDEILSVGDASFRQRCLDRLNDYKRSGGTIIFVSHNSAAVQAISDRVMLLDHGRVAEIGKPCEVVVKYEKRSLELSYEAARRFRKNDTADDLDDILFTVQCYDMRGNPCSEFEFGEPFEVRCQYEGKSGVTLPYFAFAFRKEHGYGATTSGAHMMWDGIQLKELPNQGVIGCVFTQPSFTPGIYAVELGIQCKTTSILGKKWYSQPRYCARFTILPDKFCDLFPGVPGADLYAVGFPLVYGSHIWKLDGRVVPAKD